jgi:hypothetical protein
VTEPIEPLRRRRRTVLPIEPISRRYADDWRTVRERREDEAPPQRRPKPPPPPEDPGEGHVDIRA